MYAYDSRMKNRRILALIVAHGVIGVSSCILSADKPAVSSAALIAIVFSQSSLVGMWGGLGHTRFIVRLLVVAAGTVCLYAVLGLGIEQLDWNVYFLVAFPTFLVSCVCWLIRLVGASLQTTGCHAEQRTREGLRFSIWHLMQLTFVVACLLVVGKLFVSSARGLDLLAQLSRWDSAMPRWHWHAFGRCWERDTRRSDVFSSC